LSETPTRLLIFLHYSNPSRHSDK